MATQVLNFQKLEVCAFTKEEAKAQLPFEVMKDATQAYKNWKKNHEGGITEKDIKEFCLDYLAKHTKNVKNAGCMITIEAGAADTRERPYKVNDVKNEKGKRKYKTTYQLIDKKSSSVIAETSETKAKAKEIAKSLYTDKGYKGDIVCTYTKQVLEGEPIAFEVEYTPSKSAKKGTYLCFGIVA